MIPWGVRSQVMRFIVTMITEAVEAGGPLMLGAILSEKVQLSLKNDLGENDEKRGPNASVE